MRLCASLMVICLMLPAAYGLKCFTCWSANPGTCSEVWDCAPHFDRCSTTIVTEVNMVTKQCMRSDMCNRVYTDGVQCCGEDLCNGAKHTGVFVPLLIAPVAIITLFI